MTKIVLVILFFVFGFNSKSESAVPNYADLETVVRLKSTHGKESVGKKKRSDDMIGLDLMFETRDRQTKVPAWVAEVRFGPKDERSEIFYDTDGVTSFKSYDALIVCKHAVINTYHGAVRNYGNLPNTKIGRAHV